MKKVKIIMAACLALSVLFTGCGSSKPDQKAAVTQSEQKAQATQSPAATQAARKPAEPVKLKLWAVAVNAPDETQKPQEQWVFTQMLKDYEKKNPHVSIEFTVIPDQTAVHQTIKASAMAKNGPDIVNLWAGTYISSLKEILLPLNDLMPKEDIKNIIGWEFLTDTFKHPDAGGKILGYPLGGMETGILEYNKKLVAQAGLDFEKNPPKTVEEFIAALDKIKKAGIQPIISGDNGYNALASFVFAKWWAQAEGLDRLTSNNDAKTKFSDDKGLKETYRLLQEMYAKGYINKDYATKKDDYSDFYQGKCALYPTGNWDIGGASESLGAENLGVVELPDLSKDVRLPGFVLGGVGQSLCVLNYTKYPQEAVNLISFISNKENAIKLGKNVSKYPYRKDVTIEDLGWGNHPVQKKVFEMSKKALTWHEYAMSPELVNEYYKYGTLVVTGKMTLEEFTSNLDKKAQQMKK